MPPRPAVNEKASETFLAENKKKDGVKVTASGLQYKVVKEGTGKSPKASDTVVVKVPGPSLTARCSDDSENHGGTAEFPVGGVIAGWTEGLQLMKEGAKVPVRHSLRPCLRRRGPPASHSPRLDPDF